jgi:tRNA threonylcarbamoyladenosine biosynthesis protein TsaB
MADWVLHLAEKLKQAEAEGSKPRTICFVGETALHGSEESLRPLLGEALVEAVPYELEGRWAAFLGEERLLAGSDDIHGLIPNYTQLTEAEANLHRNSEGSASKV